MSDPKLILKVEIVDNRMKVTFGTKHEGLLCNALKRAELMLLDLMTETYVYDEPKIIKAQDVPASIIQNL